MPRVERGEFVNAGVILFCSERNFLGARVVVDDPRVAVLWPDLDLELIREHLQAIPILCQGKKEGGPLSQLTRRERFHWLVSPRSTVIQTSPVHAGLCRDPEKSLEDLFRRLVLL